MIVFLQTCIMAEAIWHTQEKYQTIQECHQEIDPSPISHQELTKLRISSTKQWLKWFKERIMSSSLLLIKENSYGINKSHEFNPDRNKSNLASTTGNKWISEISSNSSLSNAVHLSLVMMRIWTVTSLTTSKSR